VIGIVGVPRWFTKDTGETMVPRAALVVVGADVEARRLGEQQSSGAEPPQGVPGEGAPQGQRDERVGPKQGEVAFAPGLH
jgi:hypothetical protein